MDNTVQILTWSNWQPLHGCWRGAVVPAVPGLYRIRRSGQEEIDYIGQTGSGQMTLRRRLAMLAGIYASEMPYRDPHTAGPALWALLHSTGSQFEVSIVPFLGTTTQRFGLEAVAIALYRQEFGRSPNANFGRMPLGYRMSTSNNARLIVAGKRFRGASSATVDASHAQGIPPAGLLTGEVLGPLWCGHAWSPWIDLSHAWNRIPVHENGLYRIRESGKIELFYVGQGRVRSRLHVHLVKSESRSQNSRFAATTEQALECSWILNSAWLDHQRLELENDLIAAHMISLSKPPIVQFLGDEYGPLSMYRTGQA